MILRPECEHDAVFCPATQKLGEFHWYLLRAATLMYSKTTTTTKVTESVRFTTLRGATTEFGKEVGGDEINWWVCRKETQLEELDGRTHVALEAAQALKQAADELRRKQFGSYPDLLNCLKQFAEKHIREIDSILEYARWLADRDILAPSILFSYRVWGTTRRSDRWIDVDPIDLNKEDPNKLRQLVEIVLGLRSRLLHAVTRAEYDIGSEMAEDVEDEATEISVPITSIIRRASPMIFEDCAVYFTELRDSLRNIVLDVETYVSQQSLIASDAFWREFITKAVKSKKTEPQLWDFKETLTMWVTNGEAKERGKIEFAEDVASFANAKGGVLIVGVTDKREIVGLGDDVRRIEGGLKHASDTLAKHLEYDRNLVTFHQVAVPGKDGAEKLCLVVRSEEHI